MYLFSSLLSLIYFFSIIAHVGKCNSWRYWGFINLCKDRGSQSAGFPALLSKLENTECLRIIRQSFWNHVGWIYEIFQQGAHQLNLLGPFFLYRKMNEISIFLLSWTLQIRIKYLLSTMFSFLWKIWGIYITHSCFVLHFLCIHQFQEESHHSCRNDFFLI